MQSDVSRELMEFGDEEGHEINRDEIESDENEDENDEHDERYVNSSDVDDDELDANHNPDEHYVNVGDVNNYNSSDEEYVQDERDVSDDNSVIVMFTEEYRSSDEEMCDYKEPVYADEIPPEIDEADPSIYFDWKKMGEDMTAYNSFISLRNFISRKKLPNTKLQLKWVMVDEDIIDTIALKFWPKNGPRNHVLIETFGEGNCGPRALAHLLLGNQSQYRELYIQGTFVAIMKEDLFLQHDVLTRECTAGTNNRPASCARYSGLITPEITELTPTSICTVYRCDVMANSHDYNFYGIWQFHHAAEAFNHPIGSIYPQKTNYILRSDMNRIILPISNIHDNKRPVHFMLQGPKLPCSCRLHTLLRLRALQGSNLC